MSAWCSDRGPILAGSIYMVTSVCNNSSSRFEAPFLLPGAPDMHVVLIYIKKEHSYISDKNIYNSDIYIYTHISIDSWLNHSEILQKGTFNYVFLKSDEIFILIEFFKLSIIIYNLI